jgi:ATP-dependent Clp protease ATP-binding subunit ClpA
MWQRFTEMSRRAVYAAQEEANAQGEQSITPEHLLLGILCHSGNFAPRILERLEIDTDKLCKTVRQSIATGKPPEKTQDMQLTPRAKRVINLAYDESQQLHTPYIGTEHLLIGYLREAQEAPADTKLNMSIDLEKVRNEVRAFEASVSSPTLTVAHQTTNPWPLFTEAARRVVYFAQEEAQNTGECYISTEHFLLGLLREENNCAVKVLQRLGTNKATVQEAITATIHPKGPARRDGEVQLSPRGILIVNLACDEAEQLMDGYIGTEHLLLALIREQEGKAGQVLSTLGIELEKARGEVRLFQCEKQ